ncbi:DUF2510 domain-containing protein [Microbacterium sp. H1-D42]|uniref:DUF2510 domain-containing protein n=1 Tax=Microbacterium sp. H1-D42 TaxID=2925844 RepID=UPI001F53B26B|nr:DUF2510 domain-containing protein [Microbacterium sp. H1-D42]UNK71992.1 DUF2510 domain-containing protein [Microbacterium sp. H1-D42]
MSTPAGWYDDGSGRQRWWDGEQWTEHFAPESGQQQPTTPDADAGAFDPDATVLREDIQAAPAQADAPTADENPTPAYPPSDYTAPGYAPPAAPGYADLNATAAYPGAYQAPGAPAVGEAPYGTPYLEPAPTGPKKTPVLGFVGFGLAILGTILACIPVTFIFGAVVLFAAFVVSLIAIFQKNTKKWPSITGLILSIIGGIVGTIIFTVAVLFAVGSAVSELPSSAPSTESSEGATPDDSAAPSGEGRPTADEVLVGLDEIMSVTGQDGTLTDDQLTCYAQYFVDSDISDDTLSVIAAGDEALTDADALSAFSEKLIEGATTCATP